MNWRKILSYPRAIFALLFCPAFTILCSIGAILVMIPFFSRHAFDKYIRFWARTLLWAAGIRLHVRGLENLFSNQSQIIVSNHLGLFDIPVLFLALPISFRMAGKEELFRIPIFGAALRKGGMIPISRSNPERAKKSLLLVKEKFKRGESFWMAPEGTRFKGDGVGEFKLGAFYLALEGGVPILPVALYGTQKVLPKNSILPNWGRAYGDVFVTCLKPVKADAWNLSKRHALRDHVREAIVNEFSQLKVSSASLDRPT